MSNVCSSWLITILMVPNYMKARKNVMYINRVNFFRPLPGRKKYGIPGIETEIILFCLQGKKRPCTYIGLTFSSETYKQKRRISTKDPVFLLTRQGLSESM